MEFKQLIIENFLSYYQKTLFDFESTTIILGQNNTGKSKLFDAINFVLYERVYDTQKEQWLYESNQIAELILNKLTVKKGLEAQKSVLKNYVELVIEDGVEIIKIKREYSYILRENKYQLANCSITISTSNQINSSDLGFYENQDARDYLSRKFSPSIKDFFLFQGESASKILKLQKNSSFVNAVREIARLEIFEKAVSLAQKFNDSAQLRVTKQMNKNKKTKDEIDALRKEIENSEFEIEELEKERNKYLTTKNKYEDEKNNIEEELKKYSEFEIYFKNKKIIEDRIEELKKQTDLASSLKATISEDAVFYKVRDKIAAFKDFYKKLEEKGEVPPSIPRHEIEKALETCRCTICGSDLSKGTENRKFAEAKLPKCDTDKLGKNLYDLNTKAEEYSNEIEDIPTKLAELIEQNNKFEKNKLDTAKQKKDLEFQLAEINLSGQSDEDRKKDLDSKRQKLNSISQLFSEASNQFIRFDYRLSTAQEKLKKIRTQLNAKLTDDEDDIREGDKEILNMAEKLFNAMEKINKVVNDSTYKQIEDRANEYYHEMTKDNSAIVGTIKVDIKNSDIYTIDENKNRIQNINQANRISIQLAIIAGILTIASEQFGIQYPFITDAPVSNLGGDNKTNTISTIINAFDQSIIILKDDAISSAKDKDKIRELIAESNEITAYELKVSKATNITEQYTIVEKIK